MGLRDVTGVFSRFFVIGFFLPSFFVTLALGALFVEIDGERPVFVIGGAALLTALVLVGLRDPLWKAFEKFPPPRLGEPCWYKPSFGGETDRYHRRVERSWTLNVYNAWPIIQHFFNDQERELDVDGRSDVHFFLNCCLGAVAVAVGLSVDIFVSPVHTWWVSLVLAFVALLVALLAYSGACHAVRPWGEFKEAAVVLHRYELYERLGLQRPKSEKQERATGKKANALLSREGGGWHAVPGGAATAEKGDQTASRS